MGLKLRSIRGTDAYTAGGFLYRIDDFEYIAQSSGRMVMAATVSSSPLVAQAVAASGDTVTIILRDQRSSGIEPTSGDFSGLHIAVLYEGI